MLRRPVAISALDRLLPALLRVVELAPRLKQQRAASEPCEVGRDADRLVVGVRGIGVASESHVRVAEHAVAVRLSGFLRDRRLRERKPSREVVLAVRDVREQDDPFVVVLQPHFQRALEDVFGARQLGDVARFAGSLEVIHGQPVEAEHVERIAGGAVLEELDLGVLLRASVRHDAGGIGGSGGGRRV